MTVKRDSVKRSVAAKLLNEESRVIFFNKKLHRIRELKRMCQNKMKINHVYDFSSFV
jgi:shikimate 5-dehydrogenase